MVTRVSPRVAPRVVSVLPSASEMLCFIGGGHLLVGRSHEDNYPESITHLPIVTGQVTEFTTAIDVDKQVSSALSSGESLYTIDETLLISLKPDIILTQDICSVCAIDLQTVERLVARMSPRPRIVSLNPLGLDDVLDNILQVGEAVGMPREAAAARASLELRLSRADDLVARAPAASNGPPCVAFIEWPDPLYVGGHWTPQLIERAGGTHPLNPARPGGAPKSFAITPEQLLKSRPTMAVLAPCGLDIQQTTREYHAMRNLPWFDDLAKSCGGRMALVDGDAMFNRPGPRLVDAYEWLVATFHGLPEAIPPDFPVRWTNDNDAAAHREATPPPPPPLPDIEEAHLCAVRRGDRTYVDPATGYAVFTQLASIDRKKCCGNGCRHCAHGHANVPAARHDTIPPPITVPAHELLLHTSTAARS